MAKTRSGRNTAAAEQRGEIHEIYSSFSVGILHLPLVLILTLFRSFIHIAQSLSLLALTLGKTFI